MIIGKIHPGSGLGDQLFSYIVTRTIALDRGVDFGFVGKEFFKGASFMNLDWGKETDLQYAIEQPTGRIINYGNGFIPPVFVIDTPYYDPEVNFIEDGTIIDGYGAQDERYWGHRLDEIRKWLKVEPWHGNIPNDLCVMNIRGGEYRAVPELILPFEYWTKAMGFINKDYEKKFEIHTDDPDYCRQLFGDAFPITKHIEINWRSMRYAKHLIISNSSIFPIDLGGCVLKYQQLLISQ